MKRILAAVFATAVTVLLPIPAHAAAPAVSTAATSGMAVTLEGIIRVLAADAVPGTTAPAAAQQMLVVDDVSYTLVGKTGTPNSRVRVTGTLTGRRLQVDTIENAVGARVAAVGGLATSGTTRVLVMLANWNVPDSVTQASAKAQMFTDSNAWYRDVSYGALGQTGDVTPWMHIKGPAGGQCYTDMESVMAQAKTAAAALGYPAAGYDNFVLYFPNNSWQPGSDCSALAGWGYVGAPGVWLNGYMDRRVTVHEEGHNYGLSHSHSYLCSNVITGSCVFSDYGDDYDAMGDSSQVGHFSAPQKNLLGWMTGRLVDLTAGGSATLAPLAADPVKASAVKITASATRTYWLEYRQPIDFDSGLVPAGTNGVQVRVVDTDITADNGPDLLDARPEDGAGTTTATLQSGHSWLTPEGFRFSVGTVNATGAAVTVAKEAAPSCPDRVTEPDNTPAQARSLAVGTTEHHAFCVANDQDWVKFTATAGTAYTLETLNLAVDTDTNLDLYKSDGTTLVASNDDGPVGVASRIDYTPTVTGTYLLKARALDSLGGVTHSYDLRITAGAGAVDRTAPTLVARGPGVNGTGAALNRNVQVTFSEPVKGVSTTSFAVRIAATGAAVPGVITRTGTTNEWVFNPTADLSVDTRYTVALSAAITDQAGNPLAATTWGFTTGHAPSVTARTPAVNATAVSRTGNITADFSEAVAGVTTGSFTLRNASGVGVAAAVSRNGTTNQWILNPTATLAANTKYTVNLTAAITDTKANPMAAAVTWSFTTGP